ncbi:MAG: hypothetical protein OXI45_02280 [Acidobacteriota bacterium]|nr:hypothetical protein [Acidobacteriota bacterium]
MVTGPEVVTPTGVDVGVGKIEQKIERFSGPIPSGAEMKAYSEADSQLPTLIFKDAEVRRDQRHERETQAIRLFAAHVRRGQVLTAITTVIGFAAAIVAKALTGSTALAIAIALFGVSPPVVGAIRGKDDNESTNDQS